MLISQPDIWCCRLIYSKPKSGLLGAPEAPFDSFASPVAQGRLCSTPRDTEILARLLALERAGQLCRAGGWTCIKVSNKQHDMRLDVPTVGVTTIEKLHAERAKCLVLEPGKTIMLEKPKVIELADRHGIAIVGYEPQPGAAG